MDVTSGPEVDFLDPPLLSGPHGATNPIRQTYCEPVKDLQLGVLRISDVREYPGVSYESSSTVVACTMATDMEAPETVVLQKTRESGLKECACGALIVWELLFE